MKHKFLWVLLILFLGCSNYQETSEMEVLTFEDFLISSNVIKDGEFYLYDNCTVLTEEEARYDYENYLSSGSRGNFSNPSKIWSISDRYNLTYSFEGMVQIAGFTDEEVRETFREATKVWMRVAGVKFIEVDNNPLFTVTGTTAQVNYTAKSFFPYENTFGENKKVIILNRFLAGVFHKTRTSLVGLFVHELGHSLGLAHEHQRWDSTNTYDQRKYGYQFGNYDEKSIMDYGNQPYEQELSEGDIAAIQHLYPQKYIIAYEHANFTGQSYKLTEYSAHSNLHRSHWGNKISSIKCFNGAAVNLYSSYNFWGDKMTVTRDIADLSVNEFNDMASSIDWDIPTDTFMIAYEHANFKGRAITITESTPFVPFNDSMSSIEIYNGHCGRLYEHSEYKGESMFIGKSTRAAYEYPGYIDLVWSSNYIGNFNDRVSSVRIY